MINSNPVAAEATILSLHQSPQPYKACRYILENSQVANARFQAAAAIREAAIREWSFLATDDKGGLINFCLGYVMQHANSSEGYVLSKVSSVAAQLMKRGWLEFTPAEKEVFFYQINQAILGSRGLDVQFIGVNFLESLVSEFSPSTSSAMGLPREFHENCRKSLEQNFLKTFYQWAQDAALSVTNKIIESHSSVPEVKVCNATLRLMHQILNWEFRYSKGGTRASINVFSDGIRPDNALSRKTECVIVQPGASWCDVLLSSSHVGWLINLYSSVRQKFDLEGYWLDCPVAVSARKLIVQLCSLAGEISPSDNGQMQEQHLLLLLSGVLPWIDPPDVISKEIEEGRSGSEMIDGCRALLSIGTVTTPVVFDKLLRSLRPFGTLTLLSMLMGEVVKVLMANSTDEETWSYEARDILLDTWTTLLASMDGSGGNARLPPEGMHAAASLFSLIVESELKVASASATTEDDADCLASVSAMDERLGSYALIARAVVDATIPFLAKLFSDHVARLHQGRGTVDPTETLEEVYSLLLIIGHVLADEGEGETALVPDALQSHFVDVVEANNHPVVVLSSSIIKFAEQCLDPEMRSSIFSPRLMEAVIWFLARWSFTYLMLVEDCDLGSNQLQSLPSRACLFTFFNEHNQGKFVLDIIVRISLTSLMSYPGEKDLQGIQLATARFLLGVNMFSVTACTCSTKKYLLDSWRNLANAFANDKTLFLLNSVSQRSLAQTLFLSAYGMRSSDASNQYVKDLMAHMTSSLVDLSNNSDLKNLAQQPDIIMLSKVAMIKCLHKSERSELIMDLTVEIDGKPRRSTCSIYSLGSPRWREPVLLWQAVDFFFWKLIIYGQKKLMILEGPNILTVVVKRFQSDNFGKLSKPINFPELLDISPYMSDPNHGDHPVFSLYAVVVHLDAMSTSFSGLLGWLVGWLVRHWCWIIQLVDVSNLASFFGGLDKLPVFLARQTIPGVGIVVDPCAALLIMIVTILLCFGIKESSLVQAIVTSVNVCTLFLIIVVGGHLACKTGWVGYDLPSGYFPFGLNGTLAGSAVVFFSYIGFDTVTSTVEEVKNPQKGSSIGNRDCIIDSLICCILCMLLSIVIVGLVPYYSLNPDTPISSAFGDSGMQ
ncbi:Peptidase C19 ubiquitin carboxyl-terminal hydrolase [Arabidopsis thaliana x Arabidopsis arenosa]|uniref:Peptidase C19 ubiquitin carboxyl-terminal hydrolase n=1 Tax=Arabidopsis thaliana x Arabidopsis arenosa TaxID=1240361 RepID=A0A8T2ASX1_9BRAS|nr:Peptidase C19 ubiquitin carboxyl-terminal hydrolase [Arabidopsis thaliana x Arabidopsis arenosa]